MAGRLTLLMISGWAHDAESLQPLCLGLREFRPMAVSLSDLHQLGMLMKSGDAVSTYAFGLKAMADRIKGPYAVLGWSMGGIAALEAIVRRMIDPSKVILVSSTARFCAMETDHPGVPEQNLRAMIAGLKRKPQDTLAAFLSDAAFPAAITQAAKDDFAAAAILNGAESIVSGLEYLRRMDLRADVCSVKQPALILHGTEDRIIPGAAGEALAKSITGSRFKEYDGKGHRMLIDDSGIVLEEISSFLGETG